MKLKLTQLHVGQRVKITNAALAEDEAVASLLTGLVGEITDVDDMSELPVEVFFSECRDWYTWYFTQNDLEVVE